MKSLKSKIIVCISVTILLFVCTFKTEAQKKAEFGLRLMPSFSSFDMKTSSGGTVKGEVALGFGAGVFFGFNITDNVGMQGEIIYSSISQKYTEQNVERKINLRYINIPLLLSLNTGKSRLVNLNLAVGPQIGISAGSSIKTSGSDATNTAEGVLSVKKGDFGFAYGGGLDFGLNKAHTTRLGIGYRGVIGLIDISDNSKTTNADSYYLLESTHIKTNSAYIGLSFLF